MRDIINKSLLELIQNAGFQTVIMTILTILLTVSLGFWNYKRQKMREELSRLYIEEGIESLLNDLVKNLNIIEKNFASALYIVKYFEALQRDEFQKLFQAKFKSILLPINPSIRKSFYRTTYILNSEPLKKLLLFSFAMFQGNNEFYASEVTLTIDKYLANELTLDKKQLAEKLTSEITNRKEELNYLYNLIQFLENILFHLKISDLHSYSQLKKISTNRKIVKTLNQIEALEKEAREKSKNI